MANVRVKGGHTVTKLQEELLKRVNSPETQRQINAFIAEASEPFAPRSEGGGDLATNWIARVDGIVYTTEYARYQWHGKPMGPTIPVFDKYTKEFRYWFAKGPRTHYTGGMMGDGTTYVDDYGVPFYTRHYTTPGTRHHWVNLMWDDGNARRKVQNRITRYLKGLDNGD